KSAQFPFHIWLPDAMEAPTPVSAYLHSATMVKAGIYIVARFTPFFGGNNVWFWAVSIVGIVTLFWGSFSAIRQTDLKALLAYSTISQLGLIMCLFGLSSASLHPAIEGVIYTQAAFAALFHLVNHSTFKGALFMVVGIVDFQVGTRDIRRLGGLMALLPMSFTIAVIGSLSMAGLPPFNGFLSKEMFFRSEEHTSELQSRFDLVCRLLLEKKKKSPTPGDAGRGAPVALAAGGRVLRSKRGDREHQGHRPRSTRAQRRQRPTPPRMHPRRCR